MLVLKQENELLKIFLKQAEERIEVYKARIEDLES
jgi:hypothetical protein